MWRHFGEAESLPGSGRLVSRLCKLETRLTTTRVVLLGRVLISGASRAALFLSPPLLHKPDEHASEAPSIERRDPSK